jgi:iron complex outermembrane receptor protein
MKRNQLACALAALLLAPVAGTAFAQSTSDTNAGTPAPSASNTKQLETVSVTGSRIRGVDMATSQPVISIDRQQIEKSGYTTVDQLLSNLPVATTDLGRSTNNNVNSEAGSSTIDLHYLGAQRTLVLVNGRRWSTQLDGTTDITTIPISIIERIDVLKDGASTIYGSDAVAGVVNIITKDHMDGVEAHINYGKYGNGDGTSKTADFTAGTHSEKGSIVFNVQHTEADAVPDSAYAISAAPYFGHPGVGLSSYPDHGVYADPLTGQTTSLLGGTPHSFSSATEGYNTNQLTDLLQGSKRDSIYSQLKYAFNDSISFRSTIAYNQRSTTGQLAAMPLGIGPNFGTTPLEQSLSLSPNSVYNPIPGEQISDIRRRTVEAGPRTTDNRNSDLHIDLGLDGSFDLGSHHFDWDTTYAYDHLSGSLTTDNEVNVANLANGLGPSFFNNGVATCGTPGAVIVGCTPINLLSSRGGLTPQQLAYIMYNDRASFDTTTHDFTANITANIAPLPAGDLSFAAGYEYRRLEGSFSPDSLTQAGFSSGNQASPTSGAYDVNEAYLEFSAPLLKDLPGAKSLSVDVSGRYSNYNNFGGTQNYKYGFTWQPIDDLLVRGSYSDGFRAPTINDLFAGAQAGFNAYTDPCDSVSGAAAFNPSTARNCVARGVPANYMQPNGYGAATVLPFTSGGNPNLQPEKSISKTLGLVYSPSYVPGLDLSLDWYKIRIRNVITELDASTILDQCYSQNSQAFCNLFTRAPNGSITTLNEAQINTGSEQTAGYDLHVGYRLPQMAFGSLRFAWDTNYVSQFQQVILPGQAPEQEVGLYSGGSPVFRVRSNLTANWSLGAWNAQWRVRYQSATSEDCVFDAQCNRPNYFNTSSGTVEPLNRVGAIVYNDAQVGYDFPWKGSLSISVNNIFARNPPILYTAPAVSSFDANYYDLPGRFWSLDYRQRF